MSRRQTQRRFVVSLLVVGATLGACGPAVTFDTGVEAGAGAAPGAGQFSALSAAELEGLAQLRLAAANYARQARINEVEQFRARQQVVSEQLRNAGQVGDLGTTVVGRQFVLSPAESEGLRRWRVAAANYARQLQAFADVEVIRATQHVASEQLRAADDADESSSSSAPDGVRLWPGQGGLGGPPTPMVR